VLLPWAVQMFGGGVAGGDKYKRRLVAPNRYQCGCYWERRRDQWGNGDVLIECTIHRAASTVYYKQYERERKAKLAKH
jgi:hypothetical protein